MELNAGENSIYLSRTSFDVAFDDNVCQTKPLIVRLAGNIAGMMTLFDRCSWLVAPDSLLPHQFSLTTQADD